MNNNSGLSKAAIAVLIIGVLLLLGSCSVQDAGRVLLWGAILCGVALLAIAIVIACVAVKKSGDEAKANKTPSATATVGTSTSARTGTTTGMRTSERVNGGVNSVPALKAARQTVTEEKLLTSHIADASVRESAMGVLDSANKVVDTLATKQAKIATSNQFLNYYLPTLGVILKKFKTLEESGLATDATRDTVVKYLDDIQQVMDKQYESLFSDDILDLAVEMEAMTIACKRDGLLSDEDVAVEDGEQVIKLNL